MNISTALAQWQPVITGYSANLVDGCFTNDSTAIIIGENGLILKTSNTGTNWDSLATLTGTFSSICNIGTDTIYAGGNCIYRSTDGGSNWNLVTTFNYTITDLGFFGGRRGFSLVPGYSYCTWSDGLHTFDNFEVYETNDFGVTWQQDFDSRESTSRFQFLNDSTAFITGGGTNIVTHCAGPWYNDSKKTTDKGNSWSYFNQAYYGHSLFSFVNPDTGYFVQAFNPTSIFTTTDGGNTIAQSYTEIDDNTIRQCKFMNVIDGFLLGKHNIYRTSSSGFCWNIDYSATDSLNFIFDNNNNTLITLGSNGTILRSMLIPSLYNDTIYRVRTNNTTVDFGFVNVDSTVVKTLNVMNTGSLPLHLTLSASPDFLISFDSSSFSTNQQVTLTPFTDSVIYIQFSPLLEQEFIDTLLITAISLDTVRIPLDGRGYYGLNGDVVQDTLICTDTLRIGGNLNIKSPAKLRICPGTYVKLLGNFQIQVEGQLFALGDTLHKITFGLADSVSDWKGIVVENNSLNDTSFFEYCNLTLPCTQPLLSINAGMVSATHCNFSNPLAGAISIYHMNAPVRLAIAGSNLYDNMGSAIECSGCDSTSILGNDIHGNFKGISFSTGSRITITGNEIHDNSNEGISGFGKISIENNRIFRNGGGIKISGSGVRIENNEVFNNRSPLTGGITAGINDGGAFINQNLIFNNTAEFGNGGGIELAPDYDFNLPAYVTNNTICNNEVGPNNAGNNFYATTNSASGLDIKLYNNIIYSITDAARNIAWFPLVTHDIQYNCINQDSINIWGQHNIANNPKFMHATDSIGTMTNIGVYDWSLRAASHCLNAGDSLHTSFLLPSDLVGNPRIYNGRVDMGAYEFQGDFVDDGDSTSVSAIGTNEIIVYPNPAHNTITINMNPGRISYLLLWDIASRLLLEKTFSNTTQLDLKDLANGTYLLEIRNQSGSAVFRKLLKY